MDYSVQLLCVCDVCLKVCLPISHASATTVQEWSSFQVSSGVIAFSYFASCVAIRQRWKSKIKAPSWACSWRCIAFKRLSPISAFPTHIRQLRICVFHRPSSIICHRGMASVMARWRGQIVYKTQKRHRRSTKWCWTSSSTRWWTWRRWWIWTVTSTMRIVCIWIFLYPMVSFRATARNWITNFFCIDFLPCQDIPELKFFLNFHGEYRSLTRSCTIKNKTGESYRNRKKHSPTSSSLPLCVLVFHFLSCT